MKIYQKITVVALALVLFPYAEIISQDSTKGERILLWSGGAPVDRKGATEEIEVPITIHRPAPEKSTGTAMIICPGGGYGGLVTGGEGHGIAAWLVNHGITGIVLEYRLPKKRPYVPLIDAQRAIRMVRANAKEWGITPGRIGIVGFSAGGHLASTAVTHFDPGNSNADDPIERVSSRPDFGVLIYPVISLGEIGHGGTRANLLGPDPSPEMLEWFSNEKQVTKETPPVYLAHALDDKVVVPDNSKQFHEALESKGVPSTYLELPSGGHGLNGYKGPMWDAWQSGSLQWLKEMKLLASPDTVSAGLRSSYYKDGELHVNVLGTPEGEPLTTGHWDFKPSWSKTGDMLVFFRRLKSVPDVSKWKTAIHIINVDGCGLHQLTDGTHTDFNQTWTRDGSNTPIWNRKHPTKRGYQVMAGKVGGKPGEEVALTGKEYHTWAFTCLMDGRILVRSTPPGRKNGYFLMTPNPGGIPRFEKVKCEPGEKGTLDRVSFSPDETKVCFEYTKGFKHSVPGRTLYVADFNAVDRTITNAIPFANDEGTPVWFAYPRWTKGAASIVYHAGGKLFLYTVADGSTKQVSTDGDADYRYPHGEALPK